jgi:outer membrane protein OmpA-like peptidoglycan-associated protein
MKKGILLSLILAFTIGINAQTIDKKWGFGGGLGAYGPTNQGGLGVTPELYLSRFLSPKLDLMLKGGLGVLNSKQDGGIDFAGTYLNLRYKLGSESKKLRPYLYGGPGYLADNTETGLNFNLGAGIKHYFKENTALYFDAGYLSGIEIKRGTQQVTDHIWKGTVGLEFDFGKTKDADMDGVSDKKDKCPNTPTGVSVDEKGCPIDTDGDGVADYMDDCQTVAGLSSLKGCPDSDKDGIADKDDACPELAGIASLKGCPDSDGDGVADKDDKCASTAKGVKVDGSGCPLDTDKDGVVDAEDECPTVFGLKENKGCPKKELTAEEIEAKAMKVEPVYFDSNKSSFNASEKVKIEKLVNLLKENANYNVKINGFADSKGTDEYNLNLSKSRINSVVKALTASKITKKRITSTKGLGEANPAATNDTEEGRALNRRVEFEVVKTK